MYAINLRSNIDSINYWIPFSVSIVFTALMFFIDEGYYSFEWILQWGNWVAFAIYVIPMFFCQVLFLGLIPSSITGRTRYVLSALFGISLCLILLLTLVFQV